jgi:hypothetical protein
MLLKVGLGERSTTCDNYTCFYLCRTHTSSYSHYPSQSVRLLSLDTLTTPTASFIFSCSDAIRMLGRTVLISFRALIHSVRFFVVIANCSCCCYCISQGTKIDFSQPDFEIINIFL